MQQGIGQEVESFVSSYLQQQGLELIATNYNCRVGEIDLIMRDHETLVFIEVRYRQSAQYGDGVATVNPAKQAKIKKAAMFYLKQHKLYDKIMCRFDIVAVSGKAKNDLIWVKDAFWDKW